MDDVVWSDADAQRLKKLRLEAGLDVLELSKQSAVSAAQISQLEEGGDSLFYSPMIKYSVGKRLTLLLIQTKGVAQESVPLIDEKVQSNAYLYSKELKAIEEMSRRDLDARPLSDALFLLKHRIQLFFQSKYILASLVMLLTMAGISLYEKFDEDASSAEAVQGAQWLGLGSLVNVVWQKTKGVFTLELNHPELSGPSESKPVVSTPEVSAPKLLVTQTPVVEEKKADSLEISNLSSSTSEPILNSQGAQATLTAEQEKWCRSELEQTPITSVSNSKPSNYIYVVGQKWGQICVKDAKNRLTWLELQAGQSITLSGIAPWKLKSQDWSSFQLFFQGHRISLPANEVRQLALFEATTESMLKIEATPSIAALPQKP